jgi:hypothetical protein
MHRLVDMLWLHWLTVELRLRLASCVRYVRCANKIKPSPIGKSATLAGCLFTERAGHMHAMHQAAEFNSQ